MTGSIISKRNTTPKALGRPKVRFSALHFTGAAFDDQALNVVVVGGGGDGQLAGKARVQQVFAAGGHFIGLDAVGVAADGEDVEAVGHPTTVLREGCGRQVLEVRAVEFSEPLFAVQRFHLEAVALEHVADWRREIDHLMFFYTEQWSA